MITISSLRDSLALKEPHLRELKVLRKFQEIFKSKLKRSNSQL